MNKRNWILAAAAALMIVGVAIGLLALFRIQQAKEFSEPHQVWSPRGTNYVVQLLETTVGKVDGGCVLIVYARLKNSNAFDVTLRREKFILIDHKRRYYEPLISGSQRESILLSANSVLDREMLSYVVPEDTLAGGVVLVAGQNHTILVKDRIPFNGRLRDGEFRSFHRQTW